MAIEVGDCPAAIVPTDVRACRYVRLSDPQATRTIVTAVLRGRSFNGVQQAFISGIRGKTTLPDGGKSSSASGSVRG